MRSMKSDGQLVRPVPPGSMSMSEYRRFIWVRASCAILRSMHDLSITRHPIHEWVSSYIERMRPVQTSGQRMIFSLQYIDSYASVTISRSLYDGYTTGYRTHDSFSISRRCDELISPPCTSYDSASPCIPVFTTISPKIYYIRPCLARASWILLCESFCAALETQVAWREAVENTLLWWKGHIKLSRFRDIWV